MGVSPWEFSFGIPIFPWVFTPVMSGEDIQYVAESSLYYPSAYGRGAILTHPEQKFFVRIFGGGATYDNVTSSVLKLSITGGAASVLQSAFSTASTQVISSMAWREIDRLATYGDVPGGGIGTSYGPGDVEVPVTLSGAQYYYFIMNAPDATPEAPVEIGFSSNPTLPLPQIYIEYTGDPQPDPPPDEEPPPEDVGYVIQPSIKTSRVTSIVRRAKRTFPLKPVEYSITIGLGSFALDEFRTFKSDYEGSLPVGPPPSTPQPTQPNDATIIVPITPPEGGGS
jgi:hypothetical protein